MNAETAINESHEWLRTHSIEEIAAEVSASGRYAPAWALDPREPEEIAASLKEAASK